MRELVGNKTGKRNFRVYTAVGRRAKLPRANLLISQAGDLAGPASLMDEFMVKPSLRTKSIGTKVTEEEYAELERAAQTGGKTLGEWCREIMLANMNGHGSNGQQHGGSESHALMAELVALRTILLNVLYKQANGEGLTAEEMQRLIERADADKLKKAAERLRQRGKSGPS